VSSPSLSPTQPRCTSSFLVVLDTKSTGNNFSARDLKSARDRRSTHFRNVSDAYYPSTKDVETVDIGSAPRPRGDAAVKRRGGRMPADAKPRSSNTGANRASSTMAPTSLICPGQGAASPMHCRQCCTPTTNPRTLHTTRSYLATGADFSMVVLLYY